MTVPGIPINYQYTDAPNTGGIKIMLLNAA